MDMSDKRKEWSAEVANMATDHAAGKAKVAEDKKLNSVENDIETQASSQKQAEDEKFVNQIEAPRTFTAQLNVPTDTIIRIEFETDNDIHSEAIEHARKHDEATSEMEDIELRIRALERGTLGRGCEARGEASRLSIGLSIFEFLTVVIVLTTTGYFHGGLLNAIVFSFIIPLTTLCAGWLVGDFSLRNMTNPNLGLWKRILAFVIGISAAIMVLILINEFAQFRGRLEDAPNYLVLGIKTLGALVFFISVYKWYQAPPANPELKLLKKRHNHLQTLLEDTFQHHLIAIDDITEQSHEEIERLVSEVKPDVSDLYLAARDVEHANAVYLSQLSELRVNFENEVNRHRAQFRDSVPLDCKIPNYFHETANLGPIFQPCFNLTNFLSDVKEKILCFEKLKEIVQKSHNSIELKRKSARNAIYEKVKGNPHKKIRQLSGDFDHAV